MAKGEKLRGNFWHQLRKSSMLPILHRAPGITSRPEVDELTCSSPATMLAVDLADDRHRDMLDLRERRRCTVIVVQHREKNRLINCETRNDLRVLECDMRGDCAAVGMSNEMSAATIVAN